MFREGLFRVIQIHLVDRRGDLPGSLERQKGRQHQHQHKDPTHRTDCLQRRLHCTDGHGQTHHGSIGQPHCIEEAASLSVIRFAFGLSDSGLQRGANLRQLLLIGLFGTPRVEQHVSGSVHPCDVPVCLQAFQIGSAACLDAQCHIVGLLPQGCPRIVQRLPVLQAVKQNRTEQKGRNTEQQAIPKNFLRHGLPSRSR